MDPQRQHVEAGQHRVEIVIVEHRIGQAIQIVQRPHRLRQFLVQTIAHFLRTGIGRHEHRGNASLVQQRPGLLRLKSIPLQLLPVSCIVFKNKELFVIDR